MKKIKIKKSDENIEKVIATEEAEAKAKEDLISIANMDEEEIKEKEKVLDNIIKKVKNAF